MLGHKTKHVGGKLNRFTRGALALAFAAAIGLGFMPPAAAAPAAGLTATVPAVVNKKAAAKVNVRTITSPAVKPGRTAVIKPSLSISGPVKLSDITLTVTQGKKTLVRGKRSAKLKAGTYTVTTTVKYWVTSHGGSVFSDRKATSRKQTLTVATAATIGKIAGKTVGASGTATVRPNVKVAKGVQVISSQLTVEQGTKTVALNKGSAALKPGRYTVTTKTK